MSIYWHRIPKIVQRIFSNHIWRLPNSQNKIYITFDDGPDPAATQLVLKELRQYATKSTFFCLGENVEKHPQLIQEIVNDGHKIANHGYGHLDGWKISKKKFFENLNRGEQSLTKVARTDNFLFRPPYGHLRGGRPMVLWTLMSGDFDPSISKEQCLSILIKKVQPGDILVFHDNEKSLEKLKWVLPRFLDFGKEKGFQFDVIPDEL